MRLLGLGYSAGTYFEFQTREMLADVLEAAWLLLAKTGDYKGPAKAADTRTLLAKYIVEIAKRGERDPTRLQDQALDYLRRSEDARRRNSARER